MSDFEYLQIKEREKAMSLTFTRHVRSFFFFLLLVTKTRVCESRSHAFATIAISRQMAVGSFYYSFSSKSNFVSFIRFQPKHHYTPRPGGRVAVFMALCCHVCVRLCSCMWRLFGFQSSFFPFKRKIRIRFVLCVHMSRSLFMGFSNFTR